MLVGGGVHSFFGEGRGLSSPVHGCSEQVPAFYSKVLGG